ncbi:hypothetical protein AAGS61_11615 [Lysinibacillus sp. KU-BSD001]|uniref:hypothetical protein n=1 Tax=Lysinibacillus sp. KU-BSD001 TaxID=3141328 RepID=UPI0036E48E4E
MSKWKQELNQLSLTKMQKEKMKQIVKQPLPKSTKNKSFVPIITPAFVLLALLLVWLEVTPTGNSIHTATTDAEKTTNIMTKEVIILLTFTMLLHTGAYLSVMFVALKVKRMQKYSIFRSLQYKIQHKQLWLILACIFSTTLAIVFIVLNTTNVVMILQILVVVLLWVNICCWQLLSTRDNERSVCPHCGVVYSRKEIWKKSFYGKFEKCSSCGEGAYVDRKKSQANFAIIYMGIPIAMFITNFGIPVWLSICYVIAYIVFTLIYIFPYTTYFTKESEEQQPPLW